MTGLNFKKHDMAINSMRIEG
uniref:Uncharacterized protein n=1 Tax=Arundo donax TaxID=35708 RepID=A0A0A8YAW6_ARUDO